MPRLGERRTQPNKPFNSFPASTGQDSCRRAVRIVDIDQVVKVNDLEPIAALSSINQEHMEILQALTIKKPTLPAQLTLL